MNWDIFGQQLWNGLLSGSIYVLFASGLSLIFGVMRVINMAHGEMAMIGGMGTYALLALLHLPIGIAALGALVIAGLFAVPVNRLTVRPFVPENELTVILSTLGVSLFLLHGTTSLLGSQPRSLRLSFDRIFEFAGITMTIRGVLIIVIAGVAMGGLHYMIQATRTGRMWRATAQNGLGAQLVGVDTQRVFRQTMITASVLAALGGLLLGILGSARPDMGQSLLIIGFAVVIVAGMGSIKGTWIVGMAMGVSEALFAQYVSTSFRQAFLYALMVLVLLLRPQGIFGEQ